MTQDDKPTAIVLSFVENFTDVGYNESQRATIFQAKEVKYNDIARLLRLVKEHKDEFTPNFIYHLETIEELQRDYLQSMYDYENDLVPREPQENHD